MSLKIIRLKLLPHLPGINELMLGLCQVQLTWWKLITNKPGKIGFCFSCHTYVAETATLVTHPPQTQRFNSCNHSGCSMIPSPCRSSLSLVHSVTAQCDSWPRAVSRFAPSQWETALLCNDVSHWLGASLEPALMAMGSIVWNAFF